MVDGDHIGEEPTQVDTLEECQRLCVLDTENVCIRFTFFLHYCFTFSEYINDAVELTNSTTGNKKIIYNWISKLSKLGFGIQLCTEMSFQEFSIIPQEKQNVI